MMRLVFTFFLLISALIAEAQGATKLIENKMTTFAHQAAYEAFLSRYNDYIKSPTHPFLSTERLLFDMWSEVYDEMFSVRSNGRVRLKFVFSSSPQDNAMGPSLSKFIFNRLKLFTTIPFASTSNPVNIEVKLSESQAGWVGRSDSHTVPLVGNNLGLKARHQLEQSIRSWESAYNFNPQSNKKWEIEFSFNKDNFAIPRQIELEVGKYVEEILAKALPRAFFDQPLDTDKIVAVYHQRDATLQIEELFHSLVSRGETPVVDLSRHLDLKSIEGQYELYLDLVGRLEYLFRLTAHTNHVPKMMLELPSTYNLINPPPFNQVDIPMASLAGKGPLAPYLLEFLLHSATQTNWVSTFETVKARYLGFLHPTFQINNDVLLTSYYHDIIRESDFMDPLTRVQERYDRGQVKSPLIRENGLASAFEARAKSPLFALNQSSRIIEANLSSSTKTFYSRRSHLSRLNLYSQMLHNIERANRNLFTVSGRFDSEGKGNIQQPGQEKVPPAEYQTRYGPVDPLQRLKAEYEAAIALYKNTSPPMYSLYKKRLAELERKIESQNSIDTSNDSPTQASQPRATLSCKMLFKRS